MILLGGSAYTAIPLPYVGTDVFESKIFQLANIIGNHPRHGNQADVIIDFLPHLSPHSIGIGSRSVGVISIGCGWVLR